MIKVGSKYIAEFKKEHQSIKNQRLDEKHQLEQFLDMGNIELRSYLMELRKVAHLPERASLQTDDISVSGNVEEEAEARSLLRKVYELTSDENLHKFLKYFKDKSGKLAKRHQDSLIDELSRRKSPAVDDEIPELEVEPEKLGLTEEEKPTIVLDDQTLPMEEADMVIQEFGKERYRNLDDDKLRLLYRSFDAKYREDPQAKYSHRLYKISEILNIRAKERSNGVKKK